MGDPLHLIRRSAATVAVALATTLALPGVAVAEVRATVTGPGHGAVVSGPSDLRVTVSRELLDPAIERVDLRISRDARSTAAGTETVALSCVSGCGSETSTWAGPTFVPSTMVPFGGGEVCNGRWHVQPSVDGGAYASGAAIAISVLPSPPADVTSTVSGDDVTVAWQASPEPDIDGYRLERRTDGGAWRTVTTVDAGITEVTRTGVAPGSYEHRVVALRPDGFDGDDPVAPCTDTGPDLSATSSSSRVEVRPEASPSPSASPTSGTRPSSGPSSRPPGSDGGSAPGDADGDAPSDGATTQPDAPPSGPDADADGDGQPDDQPDDQGSPSSGGSGGGRGPRIGAPPSARSSGADLGSPRLPDRPRQPSDDPVYYGEDGPFDEELDYDGAEPIAGEPGTRTVRQRVAGGVEVFTQRFLDPARILRPIAAGLIALTLGMHVRRWARDDR